MASKKVINGNSLNICEETIDDLSRRFLDSQIEQAISEIDVPEIKIELQGVRMKIDIENLNLDFQLDNLSVHILLISLLIILISIFK